MTGLAAETFGLVSLTGGGVSLTGDEAFLETRGFSASGFFLRLLVTGWMSDSSLSSASTLFSLFGVLSPLADLTSSETTSASSSTLALLASFSSTSGLEMASDSSRASSLAAVPPFPFLLFPSENESVVCLLGASFDADPAPELKNFLYHKI